MKMLDVFKRRLGKGKIQFAAALIADGEEDGEERLDTSVQLLQFMGIDGESETNIIGR